MRVHLPLIDVAISAEDHATPERLGGVPFGLAAAAWPKCAECGRSHSLLAQFAHDPDRLDLGRAGRMLLVFQCGHDPGMCATWEAFSGANTCLIVEPEALGRGETPLPDDAPPRDHHVVIRAWRAKDDGLAEELVERFSTDATYGALGEDVLTQAGFSTRLGGVPVWVQSAEEAPRPGWRFLGQLDGGYSFLEPPSVAASWISVDREQFEGRTHIGQGPNFGDGGIAYLFLRHREAGPEAAMFWQCG